ncbi:DHS-like NAD/FAD-binding domain-containing protein [Lepidopterella palustris CBS 459.81]|uniref:DHS-like NAD/FAD-binding domain-containing protein n=1 Tax=Lepidopterella palustris CBS 459.81 TaxID=1314670 RepID=A0A8E2E1N6_9PEZI|nr:DHS-like NAD/FAD-binding domain-containing protein [Lepidopterella palustris CBS 459.81]
MASSAKPPIVPPAELESFQQYLKSSKRILALLGAGLSASSGLPTFRGAGGLWRTHDAMQLATPEAFKADPGLVWQFYSYRRHMALKASPNRAHVALAELARRKEGFMTLSQNVDGLSQRAGHPRDKLQLLHGSLFDVKCSEFFCDYSEQNNFTDPIVPALAIPTDESDPTSHEARKAAEDALKHTQEARELDISDENVKLPELAIRDLPRCPKCKHGLLRPGVVWFGEMLPRDTLDDIEQWMDDSDRIDLIIVIGTSAKVYPAAGYVDAARMKGARVAVVNMDRADTPRSGLYSGDWFFQGDAGEIVPEILKSVVGEVSMPRV